MPEWIAPVVILICMLLLAAALIGLRRRAEERLEQTLASEAAMRGWFYESLRPGQGIQLRRWTGPGWIAESIRSSRGRNHHGPYLRWQNDASAAPVIPPLIWIHAAAGPGAGKLPESGWVAKFAAGAFKAVMATWLASRFGSWTHISWSSSLTRTAAAGWWQAPGSWIGFDPGTLELTPSLSDRISGMTVLASPPGAGERMLTPAFSTALLQALQAPQWSVRTTGDPPHVVLATGRVLICCKPRAIQTADLEALTRSGQSIAAALAAFPRID